MPRPPSISTKSKRHIMPAKTKSSKDTNRDSSVKQSIHWLGGFFGLDGYSNAARNYALGLSEIGVDISTEPLFDGCPITKESQ
ncbi:MAG: hypothetical protein HYW14_06575 [Planctomycetes bacterium]|nr:hypothetical protein [Planctomycetota bacterium]